MSLNCSVIVRNQIAMPKLFHRLEKQLAKPQGPQVASAIVQVLVDWSHLFAHEELGARSRSILAQPRYGAMAAACNPSAAVAVMEEEMRMGIPPVAPIRGEDFIRWMYRGGGLTPALVFPTASMDASGGASTAGSTLPPALAAQQSGLPGGAPPPITPALEFTQRSDDSRALSAVLSSTDHLNTALQAWQQFTGQEVYDALHVAVPHTMPHDLFAGAAAAANPPGAAAARPPGRAVDIDDLLGMGQMTSAAPPPPAPQPPLQQQRQQGAMSNPFVNHAGSASATPAAASTAAPAAVPSANPFAAAAAAYSTPSASGRAAAAPTRAVSHQQSPSLSDWDPFAAAQPPQPPQPQPQQQQRPPAAAPIAAAAASPPSSAAGSWAVFGEDHTLAAAGSGPSNPGSYSTPSYCTPYSHALSSSLASGVLPSPAASATSVSSTPNGAGGGGGSGGLPSPPRSRLQLEEAQQHHSAGAGGGGGPQAAGTPHHPTTAAAAAARPPAPSSVWKPGGAAVGPAGLGPGLGAGFDLFLAPSHPAHSAASSPHLLGNGGHGPSNGAGPGGAAGPLARSATAPHGPGSGAAESSAAAAARATASSGAANGGSSALDWRPEYDRLAAELMALAGGGAAAGGSGSAAAGQQPRCGACGGPPAAPPGLVLPRVQALCEALAAQHARRVAALEAQHAAELRDVKSRALVKIRELTAQAPAAGGAGAGAGNGGGGSHAAGANGVARQQTQPAVGGAGPGLAHASPLHVGLQQQQQPGGARQPLQPHPPPFKPAVGGPPLAQQQQQQAQPPLWLPSSGRVTTDFSLI
ncbi:hypothetical protein TSOC_003382 [Tetrabaena socialis]|uniref:VHS domain-containing protein n=1 Tax=Tetrabaena socialis TaxID=47790 RepID=A0A2J8ABP7_9CHLO|nr:hypothetical protein TSOC_003382 [Tetrabaena socialis]|eukprot:PNH09952.1 hypothetical protein TSOC_003382 [Tetrabaena socialis]